MRAAFYRRHGPVAEALEIGDLDIGALAPGEARVEVEATPVHFGDLLYIEGRLANAPPPPAVCGSEGIGRVLELGPGVGTLRVGQRVFLPRKSGTWIEQVRVAAGRLAPAPEHGDPLQLALVPVNALTAHLLVTKVVTLAPGEWLLQTAANSLVADLLALGADAVVLDGEDLPERVAEATGGAPLRFAIDAVAGTATTRLARCLDTHGTVAVYGLMSRQPCQVPADLMFLRDLRLQGYFMPHYEQGLSLAERHALLWQLGERVARGELAAKIAATYGLDEVREACRHELLAGSERDGKIILLPNAPRA
jgi:NADPH:quinone reductase-like Zn-dependent oxidoreductase